ncbi:MAG: hypothetical protein RXR20_12130 [Paraburkholderia sp.]
MHRDAVAVSVGDSKNGIIRPAYAVAGCLRLQTRYRLFQSESAAAAQVAAAAVQQAAQMQEPAT